MDFAQYRPPNMTERDAYCRGLNYGRTGKATEHNCHFAIFSTPENARAWEEGRRDGERERAASGH